MVEPKFHGQRILVLAVALVARIAHYIPDYFLNPQELDGEISLVEVRKNGDACRAGVTTGRATPPALAQQKPGCCSGAVIVVFWVSTAARAGNNDELSK